MIYILILYFQTHIPNIQTRTKLQYVPLAYYRSVTITQVWSGINHNLSSRAFTRALYTFVACGIRGCRYS